MFHFGNIFGHIGTKENASVEQLAEQFLANQNELRPKQGLEIQAIDIDSFLRSYRRWKKRNNHDWSCSGQQTDFVVLEQYIPYVIVVYLTSR